MLAVTFGGTEVGILLAIFVLLVVLVFLAIAETATNRISLPKAEALNAERGTKAAAALLSLVKEPERFINGVLVTVTALQTIQTFLVSILVARITDGWVGPVIGVVINVVALFVLSEAMPKTWAVLRPERAALLTARPTMWLGTFPPLRMIARGLIGLANWLIPGKGLKEGPFVSERELLGIVQAAAEDEVIEHEERELIESIIEFGDTVAREVMVPRPDITFLHAGQSVREALDVAIEHGLSRLPVLGRDEDDVVGIAHAKDLMRSERLGDGARAVGELARPARFVPENKPISRLMREMQAGKFHLAMVGDEYGGVAGLVTLEDCLEELVGEIVDEYDVEDDEVRRLPDGAYLVDGGMSVSDLNDLLDLRIPDEDWDTVAGFVFGTLGHVPEPGDAVELGGWTFAAEQVEGRRIRQVRVALLPHVERSRPDRAPASDAAPPDGEGSSPGHDIAQDA
jgi:CBS domain containing-hemolysin-like protein